LFLLCAAALSGCTKPASPSEWAETTGRITNVTTLPDGTFGYTLTYSADQSTARNSEGVSIKGPVPQHYLGKHKKPVDGQPLKMRYLREEPIIFELLEDIRFSE